MVWGEIQISLLVLALVVWVVVVLFVVAGARYREQARQELREKEAQRS